MAGWGMAAGWPDTPEPSIRDGWVNLNRKRVYTEPGKYRPDL